MEILGVGPSELIFIVIIALIVLGPKDMQKAGKSIGKYLNTLVKSDGWKAFQQTSREIRNLPTNLMREANLELAETEKDIRKSVKMPPLPGMPLPTNPNASVGLRADLPQPQEVENKIQPPSATSVPGGESSAEDGAGSALSETANNTLHKELNTPNQNA
jgi:sec-independent protein translocase protein TatB